MKGVLRGGGDVDDFECRNSKNNAFEKKGGIGMLRGGWDYIILK